MSMWRMCFHLSTQAPSLANSCLLAPARPSQRVASICIEILPLEYESLSTIYPFPTWRHFELGTFLMRHTPDYTKVIDAVNASIDLGGGVY